MTDKITNFKSWGRCLSTKEVEDIYLGDKIKWLAEKVLGLKFCKTHLWKSGLYNDVWVDKDGKVVKGEFTFTSWNDCGMLIEKSVLFCLFELDNNDRSSDPCIYTATADKGGDDGLDVECSTSAPTAISECFLKATGYYDQGDL